MDTSKSRGNQISIEGRAYFKALGQRIEKLRLRRQMKQAELGQILGLTKLEVAEIERGARRPPLTVMPMLAKHFGMSVSDLVDDARLPPKLKQHIDILKGLSENDQQFIMNITEIMAQQR